MFCGEEKRRGGKNKGLFVIITLRFIGLVAVLDYKFEIFWGFCVCWLLQKNILFFGDELCEVGYCLKDVNLKLIKRFKVELKGKQ